MQDKLKAFYKQRDTIQKLLNNEYNSDNENRAINLDLVIDPKSEKIPTFKFDEF